MTREPGRCIRVAKTSLRLLRRGLCWWGIYQRESFYLDFERPLAAGRTLGDLLSKDSVTTVADLFEAHKQAD
jgi:hypothetical protein